MANLFLDHLQLDDGQSAKRAKFSLFQKNRISLASEASGMRSTANSRQTHQSLGDVVRASTSSSGSSKARKSEVERLHGAVAKLADLVGGLAPQNREVKARVSEIIASVS